MILGFVKCLLFHLENFSGISIESDTLTPELTQSGPGQVFKAVTLWSVTLTQLSSLVFVMEGSVPSVSPILWTHRMQQILETYRGHLFLLRES